MNPLRLKLARWLLPKGYGLTDGSAKLSKLADKLSQDTVVETTEQTRWTPNQSGGVVIAEPKLVTIERATRGNEVVDQELENL